ncbi:MAG: ATP-dependent metallopeptidase FtsH/Yme1/Tma family protein, partial [Eubacterium sp.]|nr:ATP-dependent metallopeptidase FtsH/Yme1/Tma family protein [Eubacterium sp.]
MKGLKGYGFFILMAVIILIAVLSGDFMSGWNRENYSYMQFKEDLSEKKVASVAIEQNEQVPTGEVAVTMKDG